MVGGVQVAFEISAYTTGGGPFGTAFQGSPYVIGFVEAHGLACIIGVVLLTVATNDGRRFWHAFALSVHLLLAIANVTFWSSFSFFHVVPLGIAATLAHVLFILAHATILTATRQTAPSRR